MNGYINRLVVVYAVVLTAGWASAATFTGADSGDRLFSTTNNWATFPSGKSPVFSSPSPLATSAEGPGQWDAAFNTLLPSGFGNAYLASSGAGTAYFEVLSGAAWRSINLTLGSQNSSYTSRHGVLTLTSGSELFSNTANNGTLTIGADAGGSGGRLVAEAGLVGFSFAKLKLQAEGTLAFQFGTDSVSTFVSTKSNGAATMLLDGTVEVDLGALEQVGSYTLMSVSDDDTVLSGALMSDLAGAGGSIFDTLTSTHFNVLNEGDIDWNVTQSGQDLVLNVTAIPEPTTLGLLGLATMGIFVARRMRI